MDTKRVIKNVLFIALVPSVVVAGYYGYKAIKNYTDKKKKEGESADENENKSTTIKRPETKVDVVSEIKEEGKIEEVKEGKVIPITMNDEDKNENEIRIAKEA